MTSRTFARTALAVVVAAVLMPACSDYSVTAPDGPDFGKGKPPTKSSKVILANLVLESTTLPLEGAAVNYTVDIVNDGGKRTVVTLQGVLYSLGSDGVVDAYRAAGGTEVLCGAEGGTLPHGTCTMSFTAQASNLTGGGGGALAAGPGALSLSVLDSEGALLAYMERPVTIQ